VPDPEASVAEGHDGTFRRLSAAFEAMEAAEREAMEDSSSDDDDGKAKGNLDDEENDHFELGEEG
jgi:hypothetical protein